MPIEIKDSIKNFLESEPAIWIFKCFFNEEDPYQDILKFSNGSDISILVDELCGKSISSDDLHSPDNRLKIWSNIIRRIRSYYLNNLGQLICMRLPNVWQLTIFPETDESINEMRRVLLLLMGIAVQCDRREHYIRQIMERLPKNVQIGLMECIKAVIENSENVVVLDKFSSSEQERKFLKQSLQQTFISIDKNFNKDLEYLAENGIFPPKRKTLGDRSINSKFLWESSRNSIRRSHSQGYLFSPCSENEMSGFRAVPVEDFLSRTNADLKIASGSVSNQCKPDDDQKLLLSRLSVELAANQTKNCKLRAELDEQSEQLTEISDQLLAARKELQTCREEKARLADADRQAQHWRDELDAARDTLESLQRIESENRHLRDRLLDFNYWKTRCQDLEADLEKLIAGNTETSLNAAQLEKDYQKLETNLQRALQQVMDLEQQRDNNIITVQKLGEEIVALKLELHSIKFSNLVSNGHADIKITRNRIIDDETSLDISSSSDVPQTTRNLANQILEEKVKRLEEDNEQLRLKLATVEDHGINVIQFKNLNVDQIDVEFSESKLERDNLRHEITSHENRLTGLLQEKKIENEDNTQKDSNRELIRLQAECRRLELLTSSLKQRLDNTQVRLDASHTEMESLQKHLMQTRETTRNAECDYTKRLGELESRFMADQTELETRCLLFEQESRKLKRSLREETAINEEATSKISSLEASLSREREKYRTALEAADVRVSTAEEAQEGLFEQLSSTRKIVLALREELVKEKIIHEEQSVEIQLLKDRLTKHSLEDANREDVQRDLSVSYEQRMERLELQLKNTLEKGLQHQREHSKSLESQISAYRRHCIELKNTLNARTKALETMRDKLHQELMSRGTSSGTIPCSQGVSGQLPLDSVTSSSGLGSSLPLLIGNSVPGECLIDRGPAGDSFSSFHELDCIDSQCGFLNDATNRHEKSPTASSKSSTAGPLLILHLKDKNNELERENARLEIDLETVRIDLERHRLMLNAKGIKLPEDQLEIVQPGSYEMLQDSTSFSNNRSRDNDEINQDLMLHKRYNQVVSDNAKLEVELALLKAREANNCQQLEKMHQQFQELEKKNRTLGDNYENKCKIIENFREDCSKMQDLNTQISKELDSKTEQLRETRSSLKHVQTQLDKFFEHSRISKEHVKILLEKQNSLQNELRTSKISCERSNREIEELQTMLRETRKRLKEAEESKNRQFEAFTVVESQMIELSKYVANLEADNERLRSNLDRMLQENHELILQLQNVLTQSQEQENSEKSVLQQRLLALQKQKDILEEKLVEQYKCLPNAKKSLSHKSALNIFKTAFEGLHQSKKSSQSNGYSTESETSVSYENTLDCDESELRLASKNFRLSHTQFQTTLTVESNKKENKTKFDSQFGPLIPGSVSIYDRHPDEEGTQELQEFFRRLDKMHCNFDSQQEEPSLFGSEISITNNNASHLRRAHPPKVTLHSRIGAIPSSNCSEINNRIVHSSFGSDLNAPPLVPQRSCSRNLDSSSNSTNKPRRMTNDHILPSHFPSIDRGEKQVSTPSIPNLHNVTSSALKRRMSLQVVKLPRSTIENQIIKESSKSTLNDSSETTENSSRQLDLTLARRPLPRLDSSSLRSSTKSLKHEKEECGTNFEVDINANKLTNEKKSNEVTSIDAETDCLLFNGRAVVFLEYGDL